MTKSGFGRRLALGAVMMATSAMPAVPAQPGQSVAEGSNKVGTLLRAGDILSGELNALRSHGARKGPREATYQLTTEPHRLPPPNGLCNLETGPETFQIVTNSDADVAKLKAFVGKGISLKVEEVSCAQDAGQMSEAIVTKWSLVTRH
jgi:hypothetical protein